MNHPKTKLEGQALVEHIKLRSYRGRERVEKALRAALELENDKYPKSEAKKHRKEQCLCPVCFYLDRCRLAGAALTTSNCVYCMKETHFSSTATDDFCAECATKLKLCMRCGADIDLKDRRKV